MEAGGESTAGGCSGEGERPIDVARQMRAYCGIAVNTYLVYKLCKALEAEGVVCCHWKSSATFDRSASGDKDLGLLVSRADVQRFTEILCRLGSKAAQAPSEQQLTGVWNVFAPVTSGT